MNQMRVVCLHQRLAQIRASKGYWVYCRDCGRSRMVYWNEIAEGRWEQRVNELFGRSLTD